MADGRRWWGLQLTWETMEEAWEGEETQKVCLQLLMAISMENKQKHSYEML